MEIPLSIHVIVLRHCCCISSTDLCVSVYVCGFVWVCVGLCDIFSLCRFVRSSVCVVAVDTVEIKD